MRHLHRLAVLLAGLLVLLATGCSKEEGGTVPPPDVWDIEKDGIPRFVSTDYIELDRIHRISKFRSSFGHDYSDAFETCRSMKHTFEPSGDTDWSTIQIRSPVAGTITRAEVEWAGHEARDRRPLPSRLPAVDLPRRGVAAGLRRR